MKTKPNGLSPIKAVALGAIADLDDGWAVFNKERLKRYALFICQGMSWRLNDLVDWLEESDEAQNRSARAKRKQKARQRSK